jgi:hypothetical protein
MATRLVFGTHVTRNGEQVVEVFDGDNFVAAIYPAEHGVRIVSSHFDKERTTMDEEYPPMLVVRFTGSDPVGRVRLEPGPVVAKEDYDE